MIRHNLFACNLCECNESLTHSAAFPCSRAATGARHRCPLDYAVVRSVFEGETIARCKGSVTKCRSACAWCCTCVHTHIDTYHSHVVIRDKLFISGLL